MKSMIDFDWTDFKFERSDAEKTKSELWRKNSYDRDLKSKFVKDRIVNVISKFERAKINENAVNDRIFALSFKIRLIMLNWSIKSKKDNVFDNFSVELAKVEIVVELVVISALNVSRDVTTHNTEDCESRVLMIERSQR
jgi:hypothetical protein